MLSMMPRLRLMPPPEMPPAPPVGASCHMLRAILRHTFISAAAIMISTSADGCRRHIFAAHYAYLMPSHFPPLGELTPLRQLIAAFC